MKLTSIGNSQLQGSSLAYGCWRLAGAADPAGITPESEAAGRKAVRTAYENGFRTFDLADVYCRGHAERLFGEALRESPSIREDMVVVTKCGIHPPGGDPGSQPYRYDFSRDHIIGSCESSLRRMGVDTIDLFLLHRPDYLMDPQEVAEAFHELRHSGKVREFGVSNFTPSKFSLLQQACPMTLIAHQVEAGLTNLQRLEDGTLDQCMAKSITPMAWSPLGGGKLLRDDAGNPSAKFSSQIGPLRKGLMEMAESHETTPANIALAWLMKHPSGIVPVIGSTNPARIAEASKAGAVSLSREEWYRLLELARGERLP